MLGHVLSIIIGSTFTEFSMSCYFPQVKEFAEKAEISAVPGAAAASAAPASAPAAAKPPEKKAPPRAAAKKVSSNDPHNVQLHSY